MRPCNKLEDGIKIGCIRGLYMSFTQRLLKMQETKEYKILIDVDVVETITILGIE